MGVAVHEPAGEEWLDACCWRCGAAEADSDHLGRLLCPPCLTELSEAGPVVPDHDPIRMVRGAYWDAHALERCWRCLSESVEVEDDVGLCRTCLAGLSAAEARKEGRATGR